MLQRYPALDKLVHAARTLPADLVQPAISRYRRSRSGHLLAVRINCPHGLFAHLEWFLEIAWFCDRQGLTPCFMSDSPQYVDPVRGPDWFDYLFYNRQLSEEDARRISSGKVPVCNIRDVRHLGLPLEPDRYLQLPDAARLVDRYIGIRAPVLEQVAAFTDRHFRDRTVLGVHYRGTDKIAEAPRTAFAAVGNHVANYLAAHDDCDTLFIASDEQAFIEYMEQAFGTDLPVCYHAGMARSTVGNGIHRNSSGNGYRKALEALLDCLLLSRCRTLIKTPSILSGWAKLFNPELEVLLLARPHDRHLWFPDRVFPVWQATARARDDSRETPDNTTETAACRHLP